MRKLWRKRGTACVMEHTTLRSLILRKMSDDRMVMQMGGGESVDR